VWAVLEWELVSITESNVNVAAVMLMPQSRETVIAVAMLAHQHLVRALPSSHYC